MAALILCFIYCLKKKNDDVKDNLILVFLLLFLFSLFQYFL